MPTSKSRLTPASPCSKRTEPARAIGSGGLARSSSFVTHCSVALFGTMAGCHGRNNVSDQTSSAGSGVSWTNGIGKLTISQPSANAVRRDSRTASGSITWRQLTRVAKQLTGNEPGKAASRSSTCVLGASSYRKLAAEISFAYIVKAHERRDFARYAAARGSRGRRRAPTRRLRRKAPLQLTPGGSTAPLGHLGRRRSCSRCWRALMAALLYVRALPTCFVVDVVVLDESRISLQSRVDLQVEVGMLFDTFCFRYYIQV